MKKVVLAYSGGLDTSFCSLYLSQKKGYEVHAVMVNTGGHSAQELKEVENRALKLGVASFSLLNETTAFCEQLIKYLIFGNVLKNNTYPLSVSAERIFQARAIAQFALKKGISTIAHGSTGAGNDQVRFDMVFQALIPEVEIITPIRDLQLSREEEIEFLRSEGVDFNFEKAKYSINAGIWGTSVGGQETLNSLGSLPEEAWPTPQSKFEPEQHTLTFTKGVPTAIDGVQLSLPELIMQLKSFAAPFGIGRDVHVGDTIIGIKGRVGFEAAAPMILIKSHELLEKHTLTKWQIFHKKQLSEFYGTHLHEGQYMDPVMRDIEAFLQQSQQRVIGMVSFVLHPYRFELLGIESDYDLMSADFGTYGEMNRGYTGDDVKGFTKIFGNQTAMYHQLTKKDAYVPEPSSFEA
ncbi:MAG: argininosuccinate synthase [Cyclobacteriaceae bacterium]|nr:argininosuccinate synthase [Cyclobacteriaceae bacterium]MCH8515724.1 argininosuccinate synthase [Cyclobacteriaceae bacterium]